MEDKKVWVALLKDLGKVQQRTSAQFPYPTKRFVGIFQGTEQEVLPHLENSYGKRADQVDVFEVSSLVQEVGSPYDGIESTFLDGLDFSTRAKNVLGRICSIWAISCGLNSEKFLQSVL